MYTTIHITRFKQLIGALGIMACLLIALYVYFVNVTVHNVVARKHIEDSMVDMATEVSILESEYIAMKGSVTLDLAKERGFAQASREQFVHRQPTRAALR